MVRRYTPEQHAFFREVAAGHSHREIQTLFMNRFGIEVTESAVKSYLNNHKLKTGTHRKYTQEHIDWLSENIQGTRFKDLARMFNERFGLSTDVRALVSLCDRYGLHNGIDSRFNPSRNLAGVPYRFAKGHVPANKGKKGVRHSPATEFKKGQRPQSWKPVGTESARGDGYTWVKVAEPNKWREKHRLIWEAANGPVPAGHAVIFADGNKQNVVLENLLLISRAQLVRLNQKNLIGGTADLTRAGLLVADIMARVAERRRGSKRKGAETC